MLQKKNILQPVLSPLQPPFHSPSEVSGCQYFILAPLFISIRKPEGQGVDCASKHLKMPIDGAA